MQVTPELIARKRNREIDLSDEDGPEKSESNSASFIEARMALFVSPAIGTIEGFMNFLV